MSNSSLPIEVLEIIIEDLISEYKEEDSSQLELVKLLPRWYLTPLLRVCKLWYMVAERFLYRTISVGSGFHYSQSGKQARQGAYFAKEVLEALMANPRQAALVEGLRLGIDQEWLEWAQTNTRILQLCPNVKHVEIHGVHPSEQATLTEVLKAKSLVSFRITTRLLLFLPYLPPEGHALDLFTLMQRWSRLRSINVEGFRDFTEWNEPRGDETSGPPYNCPELQEITVDGEFDTGDVTFVRSLCLMAGRTTTLSLSMVLRLDGGDTLEPLCRCIGAWPGSLDQLRLKLWIQDFSRPTTTWVALSSLHAIRELLINGMVLDIAAIASLPRLERLEIGPNTSIRVSFASYLEDTKNFVALKHIRWYRPFNNAFYEEMKVACLSRGIQFDT